MGGFDPEHGTGYQGPLMGPDKSGSGSGQVEGTGGTQSQDEIKVEPKVTVDPSLTKDDINKLISGLKSK